LHFYRSHQQSKCCRRELSFHLPVQNGVVLSIQKHVPRQAIDFVPHYFKVVGDFLLTRKTRDPLFFFLFAAALCLCCWRVNEEKEASADIINKKQVSRFSRKKKYKPPD